jgi:BirA family biotin operon repressor/biotin-[acetyl-CoA-carboxylase] ligase
VPEPLPQDFADALTRLRDAGRLGPLASSCLYFASTGSTNDVAATLASAGDEGAVVVADEQTAGRGRRGRTWFSPAASGLYVSVVLTPHRAAAAERATALVTLAAGVALAQGLEAATGLAPDIKWPNDLLLGRRKVAGILAEGIAAEPPGAGARAAGVARVVLGYGINVSSTAYPPELADRATSLERELGRPADRAMVFAESLAALAARYDDLLSGRFDAILDAWRARARASRGARVVWDDSSGPHAGITEGIDERGALLVRTNAGVERIVAGELRWEL